MNLKGTATLNTLRYINAALQYIVHASLVSHMFGKSNGWARMLDARVLWCGLHSLCASK